MPRACCRCGQPGTVERKSTAQVTGARKTRSVTIPYCASCSTRARAIDSARTRLMLAVLGFSLLCIGFALLVPFLPLVLLIVIPTVLAVMFGRIMRERAGETVEFPNAAWLAAASNKSSTFFVFNKEWADSFAAANGVQAAAAKRGDSMPIWILALLVTGIGSAIVGNLSRPSVYVDNEGAAPLQIWVDGKKSIVAQPMLPDYATRPKIELPYGMHRFGWSLVGANAPASQTEPVKVAFAGDHLYNPDSNACYYLDLSLYGSSTAGSIVNGPVPLAEFYTFHSVDTWFGDNPKSISTKSGGGTRIALQPLKICQSLRKNDCPTPVIKDMMDCMHASPSDAGIELCIGKAAQEWPSFLSRNRRRKRKAK